MLLNLFDFTLHHKRVGVKMECYYCYCETNSMGRQSLSSGVRSDYPLASREQ